jgi:hypothetical protein
MHALLIILCEQIEGNNDEGVNEEDCPVESLPSTQYRRRCFSRRLFVVHRWLLLLDDAARYLFLEEVSVLELLIASIGGFGELV